MALPNAFMSEETDSRLLRELCTAETILGTPEREMSSDADFPGAVYLLYISMDGLAQPWLLFWQCANA